MPRHEDRVTWFTSKKNDLDRQCGILEAQIEVHSLTVSKYRDLEEMEFGLKELKLLWSKIREIGVANQMNPDEAVRKFMKDIELYDDKLGFESQLHNLKAEIQKLESMSQFSHVDDVQKIAEFRPPVESCKERGCS